RGAPARCGAARRSGQPATGASPLPVAAAAKAPPGAGLARRRTWTRTRGWRGARRRRWRRAPAAGPLAVGGPGGRVAPPQDGHAHGDAAAASHAVACALADHRDRALLPPTLCAALLRAVLGRLQQWAQLDRVHKEPNGFSRLVGIERLEARKPLVGGRL